ncbi:MAG: hypothetical protein U0841_10760 [Chloroflexia bacterium]
MQLELRRVRWGRKSAEWLRRYLPAEALATCFALIGGLLVSLGNPALAALGGTWGENVGYYGAIVARDARARRARDGGLTLAGVIRVLRNLALEFGGAELLDSFVVRPAAMFALIRATGSLPLGLIFGKVAADCVFYAAAIGASELRKRWLGE